MGELLPKSNELLAKRGMGFHEMNVLSVPLCTGHMVAFIPKKSWRVIIFMKIDTPTYKKDKS